MAMMTVALGAGACTETMAQPAYGGVYVPPCSTDSALDCGDAGAGYTCPTGVTPKDQEPELACTVPTSSTSPDDYCCALSAPDAGSDGALTGCIMDPALSCSGGAAGYSCDPGKNPEAEDTSLSCSTPTRDSGGNDDYCCFPLPGGYDPSTCAADDELTTECPDADSYGYVCVSGDDPMTLDANLKCTAGAPDPDGVHDDFCCTYD
jgi:hypothetical protein